METDWTDFFYLARAAKHADCRGRRAASSPLTEKTNLASERGREQTVPTCPLHSTPVSIITARDDDGDCTEIQSDLPTERRRGSPLSPLSVGRRASIYSVSLPSVGGGLEGAGKNEFTAPPPTLSIELVCLWFGPTPTI